MTTEAKIARNVAELVKCGVAALQTAGWTEEQIIPQLPYLASEAVNYLRAKASN
jgi:hypothetical protein